MIATDKILAICFPPPKRKLVWLSWNDSPSKFWLYNWIGATKGFESTMTHVILGLTFIRAAASVSIGCCFTAGTLGEHSWFPAFLHSSVPSLTVGAQISQSLELRRQSVLWMNWLVKRLPWHTWFWDLRSSERLIHLLRCYGSYFETWLLDVTTFRRTGWRLGVGSSEYCDIFSIISYVDTSDMRLWLWIIGWYCSCVELTVWVAMAGDLKSLEDISQKDGRSGLASHLQSCGQKALRALSKAADLPWTFWVRPGDRSFRRCHMLWRERNFVRRCYSACRFELMRMSSTTLLCGWIGSRWMWRKRAISVSPGKRYLRGSESISRAGLGPPGRPWKRRIVGHFRWNRRAWTFQRFASSQSR